MLVAHEVAKEGDAEVHGEEVNAGDTAEGDVSAAHREVPTKVGTTQRVETSDETVMDDVSNQGRMIAEMDQDADVVLKEAKEVAGDAKVDESVDIQGRQAESQAEIYKIDLEHANKGRMIAEMDQDADVVLKEAKEVAGDAKVDESVDIQGRQAESQAEIYKIDLEHANKVLSMQEDETEPVEVQAVVDVVTTAKIITKVVTASSEVITAASTTITTAEAQVPADKVIDHVKIKAKEDPAVKKYQALKRKPQTEAQTRKNMMIHLKNVASFKMDYFKGMSYDDIHHIFEAMFNTNVAFLQKTKE
nr:hypothetical protein [Tanacetum cinerariifolium]